MVSQRQDFAIGIDIGGTNTVFGIVDHRGDISYRGAISTRKHNNPNDFIEELYHALQPAIDQVGGMDSIRGIGVGAPNGNYYNGTIEYAPNLPWRGVVPLRDLMTARFQSPCSLTNDANAAAVGEMMYGVARGMKDFIMITLGTGVGSGIVANGQLIYGHDGFAGELGHVTIIPDGRLHKGTRPARFAGSLCIRYRRGFNGHRIPGKGSLRSQSPPQLRKGSHRFKSGV